MKVNIISSTQAKITSSKPQIKVEVKTEKNVESSIPQNVTKEEIIIIYKIDDGEF